MNHGKGLLQPHQLLAEFEAVISEADQQRLKDSAFGDVLRAAQVSLDATLSVSLFFLLCFCFFFLLFLGQKNMILCWPGAGSNRAAALGGSGCSSKAGSLGVHPC